MAIDTTKKVKKITVDGTEMELVGGSEKSKLAQAVDESITEITAKDLEGATKIRYYFFELMPLVSVEIPDSVTLIEELAFADCEYLENLIIGKGITNILRTAFGGCFNLREMTILATTPPTIQRDSFPEGLTTIYIPAGTLSAYQTATNWSNFSDKFVEIGGGSDSPVEPDSGNP